MESKSRQIFPIIMGISYLFYNNLVMDKFWEYIMQIFDINSGFFFHYRDYIPCFLAIICSYVTTDLIFLLFKRKKPSQNVIQKELTTQQKRDYSKFTLTDSKLKTRDSIAGKQYILQLTEDEIFSFWSSMEELDRRLEKTTSIEFETSPNKKLTVHLIGGERNQAKRLGRIIKNIIIFIIVLIGTCTGVYLVFSKLWELLFTT